MGRLQCERRTMNGVPAWRKSSKCANSTCVEVARVEDGYLIRDSKQPDLPALSFSAIQWQDFRAGMLAGEFDR
ncbi:DUF397 domain-containing protein [Actinoplanes sp. NPDC051859]|uniref:DUF397 domain-containing protein n=1 Tax=Actinoplanes sp. NPDC051859 TaxID=3363909 RepID=UPI00379A5540